MTTIQAIYRKGVFVPQTSTEGFEDGQQATIMIRRYKKENINQYGKILLVKQKI